MQLGSSEGVAGGHTAWHKGFDQFWDISRGLEFRVYLRQLSNSEGLFIRERPVQICFREGASVGVRHRLDQGKTGGGRPVQNMRPRERC